LANTVRSTTIAVCIPAWNAASHLPRLLASIAAQSCPFDQVLVYDDASTDNTAEIAAAFGATVVRAATNTGPSIGKNLLAEHTTCEWVHFHDADEALYPDFVERARLWIENEQLDVLLLGTEDRDEHNFKWAERKWDDTALRRDAVEYCVNNTVTNCGIYQRDAFLRAGGFDTSPLTKYNEDQAMHIRLALAGLRFRADDYIGTIVYRRSNSMSSGHVIECARANFHVLENVATATNRLYAVAIGTRLWRLASLSASYCDWDYVERCVTLATHLHIDASVSERGVFKHLIQMKPLFGFRLREYLIRILKPRLRRNVPVVLKGAIGPVFARTAHGTSELA
jgi:glycosyltransferase involved in cell wall biosynthesis